MYPYVLHVGVIPEREGEVIEDPPTGMIFAGGETTRDYVYFHIHSDTTDLDYTAICEADTWQMWGKKAGGSNDFTSLHVMVQCRHILERREVQVIFEEIEKKITEGRLCDYAVLTNQENWNEEVGLYLRHYDDNPYPAYVGKGDIA